MGNPGGYATLSFIPTLGTMVLGLCAGRWIQQNQATPGPRQGWLLTGRLALAGLIALAAGYSLDRLGLCPSVKKIWTPSWVLFSGGWCFLFMAAFYLLADVLGWRRLFFPLVVGIYFSLAQRYRVWWLLVASCWLAAPAGDTCPGIAVAEAAGMAKLVIVREFRAIAALSSGGRLSRSAVR